MRATLGRAALIVATALLVMGGCYAWDNSDPNAAYWYEPTPAAWFIVAFIVVLLIVLACKKA